MREKSVGEHNARKLSISDSCEINPGPPERGERRQGSGHCWWNTAGL